MKIFILLLFLLTPKERQLTKQVKRLNNQVINLQQEKHIANTYYSNLVDEVEWRTSEDDKKMFWLMFKTIMYTGLLVDEVEWRTSEDDKKIFWLMFKTILYTGLFTMLLLALNKFLMY